MEELLILLVVISEGLVASYALIIYMGKGSADYLKPQENSLICDTEWSTDFNVAPKFLYLLYTYISAVSHFLPLISSYNYPFVFPALHFRYLFPAAFYIFWFIM